MIAVCSFLTFPAFTSAEIIGGPDIIPAPASVAVDAPGANNIAQQAFDEAQGGANSDAYEVIGNQITVTIGEMRPGDWVRVVTDSDPKQKKVDICHEPPGNPDNPQDIFVAIKVLDAHFDRHPEDTYRPC